MPKFKKKIYHLEDQDLAARKYYRDHKKQLDDAMGVNAYSNEDIFVDAVKARADGPVRGSSLMNDIIQSEADTTLGKDPELRKAKREGEDRGNHGFSDLRKLNNRIPGTFVPLDLQLNPIETAEGYWEISNSSTVLVRIKSIIYTGSWKSPVILYRYMYRYELGLL